eukprot:324697-Ditylum_brightwellii.AAC.1
MVQKKSNPQRKNITPVAKGGDVKVKVTSNNMKETYVTVLMTKMNDSTNVGAVDDKRKKAPHGNHVAQFNHNKMLRNETVQGKNEDNNNEEDNNEKDIYLLGCADLATFESKLNTHFITYFEQQD